MQESPNTIQIVRNDKSAKQEAKLQNQSTYTTGPSKSIRKLWMVINEILLQILYVWFSHMKLNKKTSTSMYVEMVAW